MYKFIQHVTFIYYLMYYYLVTGSFICNVILHINATRQKDESLASKKWKMIRHPRSIRNEYLTLRLYQICGQTIEEKETIFGGHKNLLNIHHSCFKSTQQRIKRQRWLLKLHVSGKSLQELADVYLAKERVQQNQTKINKRLMSSESICLCQKYVSHFI